MLTMKVSFEQFIYAMTIVFSVSFEVANVLQSLKSYEMQMNEVRCVLFQNHIF